jgi:hypothetical protein
MISFLPLAAEILECTHHHFFFFSYLAIETYSNSIRSDKTNETESDNTVYICMFISLLYARYRGMYARYRGMYVERECLRGLREGEAVSGDLLRVEFRVEVKCDRVGNTPVWAWDGLSTESWQRYCARRLRFRSNIHHTT